MRPDFAGVSKTSWLPVTFNQHNGAASQNLHKFCINAD